MSAPVVVAMAGGGTGGHVIPAIAVANELRSRGHESVFIGTERGYEARLIPPAGYAIEWIKVGAFNRVSNVERMRSAWSIPTSVTRSMVLLRKYQVRAVFNMGGYVAAPVVLAAVLLRIPIVAMEPNAIPGMVNRRMARFFTKCLVNFPETARWFPDGRSVVTGVPVRESFFTIEPKTSDVFTLLITGGSQGSRTLNEAMRGAWPMFKALGTPVRLVHQCGRTAEAELQAEFSKTGIQGAVSAFISDMPKAFAQADLIISRAGASTVTEISASGRPAILVPFPFAADDHQTRNATAFAKTGGGVVVADKQFTPERLFAEVSALAQDRNKLIDMGQAARSLAKIDAAARAADAVLEAAGA